MQLGPTLLGPTLLGPTLNMYINKLARALQQSAAPGLTLLESEVKCLLFADDLLLLSPNKVGLQQHLDLHRFCQTLTGSLSKTKIMVLLGPHIHIPSRHS
jgi:hypothetical protein